MKIGGWQRLWIMVSGIYLILVIIFVAISFPQPESISHSQIIYNQLPVELKNKILKPWERYAAYKKVNTPKEYTREDVLAELKRRNAVTEIKMANGHSLFFFTAEVPETEMKVVAQEYWRIIEKEARTKRAKFIGFAFLFWIVPVLALYVFGWSIVWVYRGFRK